MRERWLRQANIHALFPLFLFSLCLFRFCLPDRSPTQCSAFRRQSPQSHAECVLDALSSKLSCAPPSQRFLVADCPTSLDAYVLALLTFARSLPVALSHNAIGSAIAGRPAIEDYIKAAAAHLDVSEWLEKIVSTYKQGRENKAADTDTPDSDPLVRGERACE